MSAALDFHCRAATYFLFRISRLVPLGRPVLNASRGFRGSTCTLVVGNERIVLAVFVEFLLHGVAGLVGDPEIDLFPLLQHVRRLRESVPDAWRSRRPRSRPAQPDRVIVLQFPRVPPNPRARIMSTNERRWPQFQPLDFSAALIIHVHLVSVGHGDFLVGLLDTRFLRAVPWAWAASPGWCRFPNRPHGWPPCARRIPRWRKGP